MKLTEQTSIELVRKKIDLQSSLCKFDTLDMILGSNELKECNNVTDSDLMLLFSEVEYKN